MANPIFRNGVAEVFGPPVPIVHQAPAPLGLAAVPSTIEPANPPITLFQTVSHFFCRVYKVCLDFLKMIFCGCFTKKIINDLADFNNLAVAGQINGIYITTNEMNLENIRQLLGTQPRPGQETNHICCDALQNLYIIDKRSSTYRLIIDFNPKNAEFIRKTIELIDSSESREVFKGAMIQYLDSLAGSERDLFFHPDQRGLPTERIERELTREGSWLQTEESYLYLKRELVSKGRLVPITEDIRNFDNFSSIREFLDRKNIAVDTLYMSNICNFMATAGDRTAFEKSVKALLRDDTIFINCPKINEVILSQRAVLGRAILTGAYNASRLFEEVEQI